MADKNALEVFVIVAQTRNFRLAAEQLGVTRPAISQTLRRLEDRLNLSLMQRTTRTIQLTEAGQRLYAEVAPAINQLNRAISDIAALAAEPRGQLRLAIWLKGGINILQQFPRHIWRLYLCHYLLTK